MSGYVAFFFLLILIWWGGIKILRGLVRAWYKNKMYIFHYVEYTFFNEFHTTRENGALNDLAGVGLLNEIEARGGSVVYHRTGTEHEIEKIIDFRYYQSKGKI